MLLRHNLSGNQAKTPFASAFLCAPAFFLSLERPGFFAVYFHCDFKHIELNAVFVHLCVSLGAIGHKRKKEMPPVSYCRVVLCKQQY